MPLDLGWDIGGVHLKVACLRSGDREEPRLVFRQEAFEIWRSPKSLADRLSGLLTETLRDAGFGAHAPPEAPRHGITMTAELSDVFQDRRTGVRTILAACARAFDGTGGAGDPILVVDAQGDLLPLAVAGEIPHRVAAANWAASARLAARLTARPARDEDLGGALLIDVGSTTTDIIPLRDGRADPRGHTDLERLLSGELVYTGLLRTPPSALTDNVPLGDRVCRVAPEAFTIMADAYLLLGRIGEEQYTVPTPDGRGRSQRECAARLARLVCSEPAEIGSERLQAVAAFLEDRQTEQVASGIRQVLAQRRECFGRAIVAGAGWFVAAAAAKRAGLQPTRLSALLPALGDGWDVVAPAASLAILLADARGAGRFLLEGRA